MMNFQCVIPTLSGLVLNISTASAAVAATTTQSIRHLFAHVGPHSNVLCILHIHVFIAVAAVLCKYVGVT